MEDNRCIAMYLRLSKEEDDKEQESGSIANQRRLLLSYIGKQEEWKNSKVLEMADDGYTGTNLARPGLSALLTKCSRQEVQVVIVKDFSRFSRDYLTLGTYMEQVFPAWGIRFVSVNDGYDSKMQMAEMAAIDVPFRGLLYDYTSKDISRKVKTALSARKQQGIYAIARPPLGYQRTPEGELMVEEEGAAIVRLLYRLAAEGLGLTQAARYLNERQIPTPAALERNRTGKLRYASKGDVLLWTASQVRQILGNQTYLGWFVTGRYQTERPGSRPIKLIAQESIIQKGHHEALVSEALFCAVQPTRHRVNAVVCRHPLQGKIRHGKCGHSMAFRRGNSPYFYCPYPGSGCKECRITAAAVAEIVQQLLVGWYQKEAEAARFYASAAALLQDILGRRLGELQRLRIEEQAGRNSYMDQYEAYAGGSIDVAEFQIQRRQSQERLQHWKEEIQKQQRAIERLEEVAVSLEVHLGEGRVQGENPYKEAWNCLAEQMGIEPMAEVVKEIRVNETRELVVLLRISHQRG